MVVIRKLLIALFLSTSGLIVFSQSAEKTFSFSEEPLSKVVQDVVEAFGLYVSYDPEIFNESPPKTFHLVASSLEEALNRVLDNQFRFKILDDYVIVTPIKKEIEVLQPVTKDRPIIYDTVIVEETKILYDTVEVTKQVKTYDTLVVEREVVVYDTIRYSEPSVEEKSHFIVYVAPTLWLRESSIESSAMNGASLGFSYRHQWEKFHIQAGISYNYSFQNVSYTQTEIVTELQVDTVSTFFIIEEGERVPVYVVDSTTVSRDLIREVDRFNSLHRLSILLLVGKDFQISQSTRVGFNAGVTVDWVFSKDEVIRDSSDENIRLIDSFRYRAPLQNVMLEVPFLFGKQNFREGYYVSPYGEIGINTDFENAEVSIRRYRFGIKLGVFF